MKRIIDIARTHYSSIFYLGFLMVAISNKQVVYAVLFFILIVYEITDYQKEKFTNEYIDYLEKDRDRWHKRYMEVTYFKKEKDQKNETHKKI